MLPYYISKTTKIDFKCNYSSEYNFFVIVIMSLDLLCDDVLIHIFKYTNLRINYSQICKKIYEVYLNDSLWIYYLSLNREFIRIATVLNMLNKNGYIICYKLKNFRKIANIDETETLEDIYFAGSLQSTDSNIMNIPKSINVLINLKKLYLNCNFIKEMSSELCSLSNLSSLHLMNNKIVTIPKCIIGLKQLEILNLKSNVIEKISGKIRHLTNLRSLNLSQNSIKKIPVKLLLLTNLTNLNLSSNCIKYIPKEICNLEYLNTLNMNSNNLWHLPIKIAKLTNLQSLNLSYNHINELPLYFHMLSSLRDLNLTCNDLHMFPSSLMYLTNLQTLLLTHNNINDASRLTLPFLTTYSI